MKRIPGYAQSELLSRTQTESVDCSIVYPLYMPLWLSVTLSVVAVSLLVAVATALLNTLNRP